MLLALSRTIPILVFAALFAVPAAAQQPRRPLAAMAFMAGCWRGDAGVDKDIEEQWTAADSDVMLATTRYLDENTGQTLSWEFSRIQADSAGIVLLPAPMGNAQGRFRLMPSRPGEASFQDPAHDFPKRILYRRVDAGTLHVRLDGGEGSEEGMVLRMERVPCPTGPER